MDENFPTYEEILDTLEMMYAWHALPGRVFFKRYGGITVFGGMLLQVRRLLRRAGRELEGEIDVGQGPKSRK